VAQSLERAATAAGVPVELMTAIAVEEGGVQLPALRQVRADDNVPVAGMLELRHGRLDTLALGARLAGAGEDDLRGDTERGTRAGAQVLAALGAQFHATADLASWRPALEALSGMDDASARDYANRVFAILRAGGTFPARGGETIAIAAHPELAVDDVIANAAPAADFPGAIWFTTSCTNKCTVGRPLGDASVDKIVIHDTEGGWDGSVATLQNDGGKSVHYIVDADGSRVGQFRPETDTTWHAGNYYYNETSIGIEHVGVAADASGYSDALYAKSRALVKSIRTRWSVPLDRTHIVGHYQIPDGNVVAESSAPCTDTLDNCETSSSFGGADNHRDPGYYWQWCQYMEKLGGSCTCHDAWPLWNCTTDKTEAVRCKNGVVQIEQCTGGCDVMAVGVDDVCHTDGSGSGSGSGSDPINDLDGTPVDPGHAGGCSTSGGANVLVVMLALVLVRRRR
jgi:N-acetyl-anhydromuramyl-L-alanine amidase AmpD